MIHPNMEVSNLSNPWPTWPTIAAMPSHAAVLRYFTSCRIFGQEAFLWCQHGVASTMKYHEKSEKSWEITEINADLSDFMGSQSRTSTIKMEVFDDISVKIIVE